MKRPRPEQLPPPSEDCYYCDGDNPDCGFCENGKSLDFDPHEEEL